MKDPAIKDLAGIFQYELGKVQRIDTRNDVVDSVLGFLNDYMVFTAQEFRAKYPDYVMGEEARDAKNKADSLKPIKKPKPTKKGPKNEQNNNRD
jgi:hypothetical protein